MYLVVRTGERAVIIYNNDDDAKSLTNLTTAARWLRWAACSLQIILDCFQEHSVLKKIRISGH